MQFINAESPIVFRPFKISTLFSAEQRQNAPSLIEVTLLGIFTLANAVQSIKAYSPIEVTPSEISILVNDVHCLNALSPIAVTLIPFIVDGISTFVAEPIYLVIVPVVSSK